ncbi:hypothetical protein M406DRAFT_75447 [Cryphonectria parasitica EP155]|uniref:Uncharacterized protein n=1 Tax=Cryphonectria parasitica (strain ATCC 38755 / EP155) TaxID=660469 RepID=A0A9P4XSF8_CRYP1|nr:uncharacterized protein M406DRAFT_75447 [Cryphonectria parasitica EP155]KAF3760093.1 hypothetical protein M406DRAFT_75447 [Cryphonectria parasitica EP155]
MLGFLWMSEEEISFDPTFKRTSSGQQFIEINRNACYYHYKVVQGLDIIKASNYKLDWIDFMLCVKARSGLRKGCSSSSIAGIKRLSSRAAAPLPSKQPASSRQLSSSAGIFLPPFSPPSSQGSIPQPPSKQPSSQAGTSLPTKQPSSYANTLPPPNKRSRLSQSPNKAYITILPDREYRQQDFERICLLH